MAGAETAPSVGDVPQRSAYTEKQIRTEQAKAALRGVTLALVELDRGGSMFVVSRRGAARTCATLGEAAAFVDVLAGGAR